MDQDTDVEDTEDMRLNNKREHNWRIVFEGK